MGVKTEINYVHHTFNPWWGCSPPRPDRPGCLHCYARAMDHHLCPEGVTHWGPDAPRRFFSHRHWNGPLAWDRAAARAGVRRRVLCGSMCDWLEDLPGLLTPRDRLLRLVAATRNLDWLLLSKRLANTDIEDVLPPDFHWAGTRWPANAWIGATTENQAELDAVAGTLSDVAAYLRPAVIFISAEPLLGPIDLAACLHLTDWTIVGGESGPRARPMDPEWVRSIRDQCQAAAVPFFFKQWGEWIPDSQVAYDSATLYPPVQRLILAPSASSTHRWQDGHPGGCQLSYRVGKKPAGRLLDGREWDEFPALELRRKGHDQAIATH